MSTSYDEVPYDSHAFPQSHPDRLATIGQLFGLDSAPVTGCRVLELGCASGGNLIPMAYQLPGCEFVGVDLSDRQAAAGRSMIEDLGLANIRILTASVSDIDRSWGSFDYILCHGVYSWVSNAVQERILGVCAEHLAPCGIAFVSYNTYPGWHMREVVRHAMCYHAGQFAAAETRIEQARAFIDFMVKAVPAKTGPYAELLKGEFELIGKLSDAYLFHEHLEEVNVPVYFHQFMERAQGQGLQYLGEADFSTMLTSRFSDEVAQTLDEVCGDIIRTEQYMDYLRNRLFRQTLLCRADLQLKRDLDAESIAGLLAASNARPSQHPLDLSDGVTQEFRTQRGASITTAFGLTKAALTVLGDHWPRRLSLDELLRDAEALLASSQSKESGAEAKTTLFEDLLHCYTANAIEFHSWQPDQPAEASAKPCASALARYQVSHGRPVVNQRHETVALDALEKDLLAVLDGTRDRDQLLEHFRACSEARELTAQKDATPSASEQETADEPESLLDEALRKLARSALLLA